LPESFAIVKKKRNCIRRWLAREKDSGDRSLLINSLLRESDARGRSSHVDTLLSSMNTDEKFKVLHRILAEQGTSDDTKKRERAKLIAGLVDESILEELQRKEEGFTLNFERGSLPSRFNAMAKPTTTT